MPVKREGFTTQQWDKVMFPRIQDATIAAAERALTTAVQTRNFDRQPVVVTDGRPRADYRLVKPYGRIEFLRRANMVECVKLALKLLIEKSPVGPGRNGHYRDRHVVMIDGAEIKGDLDAALATVKPGQRVQIVNVQPYARRLEGATANKKTGRGKRRGASKKARGGIYRPVQRLLLQRYGKALFIDYKNVKLNLGVKVWGDQGGRFYNRLKKDGGGSVKHSVKRVQRDQVYPALQFYIKPEQ